MENNHFKQADRKQHSWKEKKDRFFRWFNRIFSTISITSKMLAIIFLISSIAVGVYLTLRPKKVEISNAASFTEIEGYFTAVVVDDFENSKSTINYYITDDKGNNLSELEIVGELSVKPGEYVMVVGSKDKDGVVVIDTSKDSGYIEILNDGRQTSEREPITGEKRVALILIIPDFFSEKASPAPSIANQNFINRVQPYYYENSFGKLTITSDVYGWYTIPSFDPTYCSSTCVTQLAIDAADPDVNFADYDQIVLGFYYTNFNYGIFTSSTWGPRYWNTDDGVFNIPVAYIDSKKFENTSSQALDITKAHTINHELGHSYGVLHSNGWDCGDEYIGVNCSSIGYADSWDVMGFLDYINYNLPHFGAYHKEFFGWFENYNILEVSQSGTYQLFPIEKATDSVQVLKIPIQNSEWYYIENREKIGYDATISNNAVDGGLIKFSPSVMSLGDSHMIDSTPNSGYDNQDFWDANWTYGKTMQDPYNNLEITPISKVNGILTVVIEFSSPPPIPPSPSPETNRNWPPVITTTSLPTATLGQYYAANIVAQDNDADEILTLEPDDLPRGINTFSCVTSPGSPPTTETCQIFGKPTRPGSYEVNFTVTDSKGTTDTKKFKLIINK